MWRKRKRAKPKRGANKQHSTEAKHTVIIIVVVMQRRNMKKQPGYCMCSFIRSFFSLLFLSHSHSLSGSEFRFHFVRIVKGFCWKFQNSLPQKKNRIAPQKKQNRNEAHKSKLPTKPTWNHCVLLRWHARATFCALGTEVNTEHFSRTSIFPMNRSVNETCT